MNGHLSLRFLGAARTVTGSKFLLTINGRNILVDCGLFQGLKELRLKNWDIPPIDPKTIDAIVLTHAHIDHSGYIPRMVKEGFRGRVICTPATLALCRILLPDTGYLLEEEAEYLTRKKISKHKPALPLFSREEAEAALKYFEPHNFHEDIQVANGIRAQFYYAGHILGAASVVISVGNKKIGFSGDVGRQDDPVFRPPEPLPKVDYLVVESTYGNRLHPDVDPAEELRKAILKVFKRKGVMLIPAFAVGRTQTLLYLLAELKRSGQIPDFPMYVNSPMATSATDIFCQFQAQHKLSDLECREVYDVVHYVRSADESRHLNSRPGPMLIISASGMATGGRILHHLKEFAPDPKNMIMLTGFQAAGTRGRSLQDHAKEVKLHGQYVPIRAEVSMIENLSAHGDYQEIISWLKQSHLSPRKVFVAHGEPSASESMGEHLRREFGWDCIIPAQGEEFHLD